MTPDEPAVPETPPRPIGTALAKGIAGGILGGAVGYLLTDWIAGMGPILLALPGALAGIGFGLASRTRSAPLGVVAGVLGFAAGIVTLQSLAAGDPGFVDVVTSLTSGEALRIGVGTLIAFWFGWGR